MYFKFYLVFSIVSIIRFFFGNYGYQKFCCCNEFAMETFEDFERVHNWRGEYKRCINGNWVWVNERVCFFVSFSCYSLLLMTMMICLMSSLKMPQSSKKKEVWTAKAKNWPWRNKTQTELVWRWWSAVKTVFYCLARGKIFILQ